MMEVLQRVNWTGEPKELDDFFRLTRNRRLARAVIFTHQFGWELRLLVGSQSEVVQSQVCRTQEEVFSTGEQWKAAMIEKGLGVIQCFQASCARLGDGAARGRQSFTVR